MRRFASLVVVFAHDQVVRVVGFEELPRLCDACLAEPSEREYFAGTFGGEPPRVRLDSTTDFEELARAGRVLIVENASAGGALAGWSCAKLAQEFPDAKMRREYDWDINPDDRNLQKLGDAAWIEETVAGEDAEERARQDSDTPPYSPFYWAIREHRQSDIGPKKVVAKIRQLISDSVPSFMDQENAKSMFDNAEMWLGAKGTGARAHMDSHCISTISVVLSGERRWRVGPPPRLPKGGGRSKNGEVVFDDGVAYRLGWKPMFEFTVKEGEAVLFPPGWIHETLNIADGCTVALTTQFSLPYPARYYRSYYQRLRRIGDLNPCWGDMIRWGSVNNHKQWATMSDSEVRDYAEKLYKEHWPDGSEQGSPSATQVEIDFHDLDGDGKVTQAEFVNTLSAWAATELAIRAEKQVRTLRFDMSLDSPTARHEGGSGGEEL